MDEAVVQWRRDVRTSRTVRVLWSVGIGTFIAAAGLIVVARLYTLLDLSAEPTVLVATAVGAVVGVAAVAIAVHDASRRDRLADRLPFVEHGADLARLVDTAVAAVAVAALILALVTQVGGGVGNLLAASTIPLGMLALVLATLLRSTGTLDRDEGRLFLHDSDAAIDLSVVEGASVRPIGPVAVCRLRYGEDDGVYVPGPRWLWLPPDVARELVGYVGPVA